MLALRVSCQCTCNIPVLYTEIFSRRSPFNNRSFNYWVYLSLGLNSTNALTIICLQAILYVAIAFIPTPGAAGGAEAGFLLIFGPIYGVVNAPISMILWRIISFYFILIFGAVYLSIHSIRLGKDKVKVLMMTYVIRLMNLSKIMSHKWIVNSKYSKPRLKNH